MDGSGASHDAVGQSGGEADRAGAGGAEQGSLAKMYESHSERLRRLLVARFAVSRVGPTDEEIEDIVQETFRRVLEGRSRGVESSGWVNALGYLFTVARNAFLDARRRRSREQSLVSALMADDTWAQSEERGADPCKILLQVSWLTSYVRTLPDDLRRVYTARFVDGFSQEATAGRLGLTRRAVRTLERRLLVDVARSLRARGHLATEEGCVAAKRSNVNGRSST